MKQSIFVLVAVTGAVLAACGGGSSSGPDMPPGMIGGSSHMTLHGVSTMRSLGTYRAEGSANIIGVPNACEDPKPSMWHLPCPSGVVTITKTAAGWLEDHQLPAHVAAYSTRFEFSDDNGVSVDHEGCTYAVGGVRTTLARHPTSLQPVQFERTCPGRGTKSYNVTVREVVVGNATSGSRTSTYTLSEGGVKAMTINFLAGLDGGKLLATTATYAYFDGAGSYTGALTYWTITP